MRSPDSAIGLAAIFGSQKTAATSGICLQSDTQGARQKEAHQKEEDTTKRLQSTLIVKRHKWRALRIATVWGTSPAAPPGGSTVAVAPFQNIPNIVRIERTRAKPSLRNNCLSRFLRSFLNQLVHHPALIPPPNPQHNFTQPKSEFSKKTTPGNHTPPPPLGGDFFFIFRAYSPAYDLQVVILVGEGHRRRRIDLQLEALQ